MSGPSLLIESTDSMIVIEVWKFFFYSVAGELYALRLVLS